MSGRGAGRSRGQRHPARCRLSRRRGRRRLRARATDARGDAVKPVWAIAADSAFSAAYVLASRRLPGLRHPDGGVGSIGVIACTSTSRRAMPSRATATRRSPPARRRTTSRRTNRSPGRAGPTAGRSGPALRDLHRPRRDDARPRCGRRARHPGRAVLRSRSAERRSGRRPGQLRRRGHRLRCVSGQSSFPRALAHGRPIAPCLFPSLSGDFHHDRPHHPRRPRHARPPPQPNPPRPAVHLPSPGDDGVQSAIDATRAEALAIAELCQLAGYPQRIVTFLAQGASATEVRRALLAARAEGPEIDSRLAPDAAGSRSVIPTTTR
jgi:hypothetical protein